MSIKIIRPGVQATLQDGGRFGYRSIGVGSGGAMDIFAMKVANYLCGNDDSKAAIEINFPAPEILFQQDAMISLTGAEFSATINEITIPVWRTVLVKKDSVIKFVQPVSGAKVYLAVKGGWKAQQWLNSYSTLLKLGAGGNWGRALKKEDEIDFIWNDFSFKENRILPWQISQHELDKVYQPQSKARCIKAPEYDWLDEASQQYFVQNNFTISNQSDRMGYRLNGNRLSLQQPMELISSAVDAGTVQLLPDGNSIVLMADHQTTGGYPRIASVIKADLPKLAQLNPGKTIHFTIISIKEAEDALFSFTETLVGIKNACHFNFKKL
jgi:antagonist of KipI